MHSISTVTIKNNDCKIWNRDQVILDLVQAMYRNDNLIVDLNNEGPCADSLGLYSLLNEICDRIGYDFNKITIKTCNLLEQHKKYSIVIRPPFKHIAELQSDAQQNPIEQKKITNTTKHFGHFIGHSSRGRLAIASWLYKNHSKKSLQTFHTVPTDALHNEFVGLEDMWFHNYENHHIDNSVEFLRKTPITYDPVGSGPILNMKVYGILGAYRDIFVDIVCNTYITGRTFYMDDKLWRPIITKTPFIVHGPKNFIKNLHRLGFKTFGNWWDEGYSEDAADWSVKLILQLIDSLASKPIDELDRMYQEMESVLDHNYNLFMRLQPNQFFQEYI